MRIIHMLVTPIIIQMILKDYLLSGQKAKPWILYLMYTKLRII
jgi:hypothetical protein